MVRSEVSSGNTRRGSLAVAITPPVPVGTRDGARPGLTSTRPDGRPEDDGDETARSSAQTVDPECRVRGWRVAFRDCNERPILEGFGEDDAH